MIRDVQEHIIYLPGLGDHHSRLQQITIKLWRLYGVIPHFHQINWADGKPFEPKLRKILNEIDTLSATGTVSLVGISAGGSAALNAFAERQDKVKKVVTICGKLQNMHTIQEWRFKKNPAFRGSAGMLKRSLERLGPERLKQILNFYPLRDGIVPVHDAVLQGSLKKRIPTIGHAFSIGCTILFGARSITKFVKSR